MKKRTCGTCGYFQESDMSGLGWCLHPQRRVTHDLKIMVRRGELGCRDGWSRDLWAPSGEVNVAAPAEASLTGPVRPVTPEEMTYLVASKHVTLQQTTIGPISSPVDVVVGETPAMPVDEDRATLLSHDPRAAIEAARKRHLANLQGPNQPTPTPQAPATSTSSFYADSQSYHSTFTPPLSSPPEPKPVEQQVAPRQIVPRYVREVAPVRPDEVPRDTTGTASTREDESHFSSVPDLVDGFDLPREGSDGRPVLVAGTYDDDVEIAPTRVRATRRWPIAEEEIDTPAIELASAYAADAQQYEEAPIRGGAFEDDWNYESDETNYEDSSYSEEEIISEPPPRRRWQPSFRFQRPARAHATEYVADEWEEDYYEDQYVAPNESEIEPLLPDPAFEWREPDDPLETSVEVAPMIPRMCRTCRDFRPADNGGRGWCTNKWAFSHRRMVDEDELPCETSLGCWWLPHDDVWLAEADAAAHTEPTPLVDHWLERRTGVTAATGTRRR